VLGRRYHFHSPGVAYAVTTMVLVLGAINGQNNLLFWLFGLGVGGLIVSGLVSGGSMMRLQIERLTPEPSAVGEELIIRYRVTNRSRIFPAFGLIVEELSSARRGSLKATWAGRLWAPVAFAPYVPAAGSVVVEARVGALKRGPVSLGPLRVWTTFPFGLTKKSKAFHQETEVLVRPRPAPLRAGLVQGVSGKGEQGAMLRRSRVGEEFYSLREYAPGDSMRSVAWRSTARLGYAVVREMAVRPSRHLWIMADLSGDERRVERVLSVAAALCARAVEEGLEPGLALAGGRILEPARAGRRHVLYLMDAMARLDTRWAVSHAAQLPVLPSTAFTQDAFITVSGEGGPVASPKVGSQRIDVDDPSVVTDPAWTASIEAPARKPEGAWEELVAAARRLWRKGRA
jgi:uncharacterized protein (DUF58 family)